VSPTQSAFEKGKERVLRGGTGEAPCGGGRVLWGEKFGWGFVVGGVFVGGGGALLTRVGGGLLNKGETLSVWIERITILSKKGEREVFSVPGGGGFQAKRENVFVG